MKQFAITWSGDQSRKNSHKRPPEPTINHIQRGDGYTLCGIFMDIMWRSDFHYEDELINMCKRCYPSNKVFAADP